MRHQLLIIVLLILCVGVFADEWQPVTGNGPSARFNHVMVEIDGIVYVFGGENNATRDNFNDLWAFNVNNNEWLKKNPSNPPSKRSYSAAAKKDNKMYIFGGQTTSGTVMDVWEYDPAQNKWTEKPSSSGQNPKLYHRATAGDNKIWITGGLEDATGQATGEIWGYDTITGTWTKGADCPSPRYGHAAFYKNGNVYITAGRRGDELLDDMWKYDVARNDWQRIVPKGKPTGVKFAAFDANAEVLWMAGGTNLDSGNFVDSKYTWEYNIAENKWDKKADGPAFSFGAGVILPGNRANDYKTFIFGGSRNGQAVEESWQYDSDDDPVVTNGDIICKTGYLKKGRFTLYILGFKTAQTKVKFTINCPESKANLKLFHLQCNLSKNPFRKYNERWSRLGLRHFKASKLKFRKTRAGKTLTYTFKNVKPGYVAIALFNIPLFSKDAKDIKVTVSEMTSLPGNMIYIFNTGKVDTVTFPVVPVRWRAHGSGQETTTTGQDSWEWKFTSQKKRFFPKAWVYFELP